MFISLGLCFAIIFYSNAQTLHYVVANNNIISQQQQQYLAVQNDLQSNINYNNYINRTNNNNNNNELNDKLYSNNNDRNFNNNDRNDGLLIQTQEKIRQRIPEKQFNEPIDKNSFTTSIPQGSPVFADSLGTQQNIPVNDRSPESVQQQQEQQKPFSNNNKPDLQKPIIQDDFSDILNSYQKPIIPEFIPDFVTNSEYIGDSFDWALLKRILAKDSSKNIIISPFSIKLVLSLLLEAAGNNTDTQKELLNVLGLNDKYIDDVIKNQNLSKYWNRTIEALLKKDASYDLLFGSQIFADNVVDPTYKYRSILERFYHTGIEILPFKNSSASADTINLWSANATNGHIKKIVTEEQLKSAVMLILNAIYFKGKWKYSFDKDESFVDKFYYEATKSNNVEYITKRDYYNFMDSSNLDAKIIQIPYEGDRFQLTILLPRSKDGINELIHNINPTIYKNLEWSADDETEVKLTIPKLNFAYETSLKDILMSMGVQEIFSDQASLALIDRGERVKGVLKVSDIYQKSGLQLDETGTIAYAETVAAIENKFGGGIEDFNANRPFLFFIQDIKEKKILFAGKIVNPLQ
ncbi:serine protease inhibitor 27A-like [Condylostylus longicornis]|uniref:serine protease inhibitor 27A-like n=1 Tax=Condylostylus longicornis TaxID=2530218 RepID=UPI00244D9ED7|nr:serine protease inhibitor 27A-like [Condylostylus longicornis]